MVSSKEISHDSSVNCEENQDKFQRKEAKSGKLTIRLWSCALPHSGGVQEGSKTTIDPEVKDKLLKDYQNDKLGSQSR